MTMFTALLISLSLGSVSHAAMPVVNLNEFGDVNCSRSSQNEDFRNLIQKVAVSDEDDREVLSKNKDIVGFNAAEEDQANACTGRIFCPGANVNQGGGMSAGAICPTGARAGGQCAPDRIATAMHLFVNKASRQFIPKLDQCEFRNYRGFSTKLVVGDIRSKNPRTAAQDPFSNRRADKMVVRLQKPIPGCDPYDLDEKAVPPRTNGELIVVSYPHADQRRSGSPKFDGREPLAYRCKVTGTFAPKDGGPSYFYNNCDINSGGSGSFALVRNADGRLAVTGIITNSADESLNGRSYKESDDLKEANYTIAVGVNGDFAEMAKNPAGPGNQVVTGGDKPKLSPVSD